MDEKFMNLTKGSRSDLIMVWILAAEKRGWIRRNGKHLGRFLGSGWAKSFDALVADAWLLCYQDAIKIEAARATFPLPECPQDDSAKKEKEKEIQPTTTSEGVDPREGAGCGFGPGGGELAAPEADSDSDSPRNGNGGPVHAGRVALDVASAAIARGRL